MEDFMINLPLEDLESFGNTVFEQLPADYHKTRRKQVPQDYNAMDAEQFYPELPPNHIRLLQLDGMTVTTGELDRPRLRMFTMSLADIEAGEFPYKALSYCWGSEPANASFQVEFVHVNDCRPVPRVTHRLEVTPNLWHALVQLQEQRLDYPPYLWVDAICINQSDVREKNHQVGIMSEIYKLARVVVCWLGSASKEQTKGIGEMRRQVVRDAGGLLKEPTGGVLHVRGIAAILMESGWFDRSWTFQEIVLARRAVLQCGKERLDFELVANGVMSGWYLSWMANSWLTQKLVLNLQAMVLTLAGMRRNILKGCSLRKALVSIRNRQAGDLRDKIYAVMGLVSAPNQLAPDYYSTIQQVFTQATIACIEQEQSLEVLSYCDRFGFANRLGLPSWVPDWSQSNIYTKEESIVTEDEEWRTSPPDWYANTYSVSSRMLTASGVALGYLQNAGSGTSFSLDVIPFPVDKVQSGNRHASQTLHESYGHSTPVKQDFRELWSALECKGTNYYSTNSIHCWVSRGQCAEGDWLVHLFTAPGLFVLRPAIVLGGHDHQLSFSWVGTALTDSKLDATALAQESIEKWSTSIESGLYSFKDLHTSEDKKLSCVYGDFRII